MEQLFARINKALQSDLRSLIRTVDNPEKVLAQIITEMAEDSKQFRQTIDTCIADQKTIETEDNLKDHTQQIMTLRALLLKLETKRCEAKWILSELGENSNRDSFSENKRPPSNGPSGAEANPYDQALSTSP